MDQHFLYIIAANDNGPVKLGISRDPDKRVRQLQTGHSEHLKVFYREPVETERARIFERLLHRDNYHLRQHGEWFRMSVEHAIAYVQFTIIQYDLKPLEILKRQLKFGF